MARLHESHRRHTWTRGLYPLNHMRIIKDLVIDLEDVWAQYALIERRQIKPLGLHGAGGVGSRSSNALRWAMAILRWRMRAYEIPGAHSLIAISATRAPLCALWSW